MQKQLYNPAKFELFFKMGTLKCKIVICDNDHRETIKYIL